MTLDPIRTGIAIALLALLAFGGWKVKQYGDERYEAGQANVQAKWDAPIEKGRKEVERLRIAAGKVTVRTEIQYRDRIVTIREKGDVIEKRIPVYVPAGSVLPGGFRLLHDDAAAGTVSDAAALAHAAPVDAQAVAGTVADNYRAYHETAARLTALQDWVLAQCKANPPPEGCP